MNSICIYVLKSLSGISFPHSRGHYVPLGESKTPLQPLDSQVNSIMRVQMKECQIAAIVGKDRLIFYFVYMEYTVRTCQREVVQLAKAILVVQCTIRFAET